MSIACDGCLYSYNDIKANGTVCSNGGMTGQSYVRTPGYLQVSSIVYPWSASQACVRYATANAAGNGWLCPLLLCRCGGVVINGGTNNTSNDAALFICQTNNNDWALRICKNTSSATEYGIKVDMGATATYGYDAVFGGTRKFTVSYNCMCHSEKICSGSCVVAPRVCGSTCVRGGVVCATSGFYGDGSNLTGISGGGGGLCNSCVGDGNLCGFVVIGKCAAGNNCFGGLYSYDNTIAIGINAMQNYSNTASNFGDQIAIGPSAMVGSSNTGNCRNVAVGKSAGGYIAPSVCYNTAIGTEAMGGTSSYRAGSNNTAIGGGAGYFQCGQAGTFVGQCAGAQGAGAKSCGTFIGHCAGYGSTGVNGVFIGHKAGINCSTSNITFIGSCGTCVTCICGNVCVSSLSKGSGSFVIPHPDPAKTDDWELKHSFVESPNEGDNIYRWKVDVTNCCHVIELPSYYKFLNKNDMAWVSPNRHFGAGYAEVTDDQQCLVVCTNNDGSYNILLIGTRKDEVAVNNWKAAEIRKI